LKELLSSKKFASRFSLELKFTKEEETTVVIIEEINHRITSSGRKYEVLTVNDFTDGLDTNNDEIRSAAFDLLGKLNETVKKVTSLTLPKKFPITAKNLRRPLANYFWRVKTTAWRKSASDFGHPNWLRHKDEFQLSLGFCKRLVDAAPNLKELKLYNIRDAHEEFVAHLAANKPETFEVIELYATDPSSKRMKLDN